MTFSFVPLSGIAFLSIDFMLYLGLREKHRRSRASLFGIDRVLLSRPTQVVVKRATFLSVFCMAARGLALTWVRDQVFSTKGSLDAKI
jgi:hypothetical protein